MKSLHTDESPSNNKFDQEEIMKMVGLLRKIIGALRNLYALASSPLSTTRDFKSTYRAFVEARDAFWTAEIVFSRNLKKHKRLRPLMKTISSPLVRTSILCESEIAGVHDHVDISPQIEESIELVRGSLVYLESTLN
jgi:hypothetical protein